MNILSAKIISSEAKDRNCDWEFSHAGASGGQFVVDAEAQVFFSVKREQPVDLEAPWRASR